MIRVVYRWKVTEENRAAFQSAWERVTTTIRANTDGARGSFLLESVDDPTECLTIATWEHLDQWQAFVGNAPTGPMQEMHSLAERVSHQAFLQIADHTV